MSYADITFANEYFANRAFSDAWNGDGAEKEKFLFTATEQIKTYAYFLDEMDMMFYYEEDDDDIPSWLKKACCEQAIYLMNLGKDPTQADKKTTLGIARTDDGTTFDKKFAADVLCVNCRKILERNGGIIDSNAFANGMTIEQGWILK